MIIIHKIKNSNVTVKIYSLTNAKPLYDVKYAFKLRQTLVYKIFSILGARFYKQLQTYVKEKSLL